MPNFYTATVTSKEAVANKFFILKCSAQSPLSFVPGQYLIVKVAQDRVVQYSITSLPENDEFELLVEYLSGGQASEWVKNTLQVGDTIEYLGPMGIFTVQLSENSDRILFLATGSGIAPYKSMIDDLLFNQKEARQIHLYFGLRSTEELVYHEHFNQLENDFPNFQFNLCISQPGASWTGKKGRITYHLQRDFPNTTNFSAYLCGSQSMIDEGTQILLASGCEQRNIYTEKFW